VAATHFAHPEYAGTYARARTLSDGTLAQWAEILGALTPRAAVRSVLDLGAGTGRFSALLADVYASPVVAVEPALAMLDQRAASLPNTVRFVAAAAEALPLSADSIDLAFLSMVYHHLANVPVALGELRRVVRAGGCSVVRTATREIVESIPLFDFFPEARDLDRRRMPWRNDLVGAFERQGFAGRTHITVQQRFADDPLEWLHKISLRGLSSLQLLPDDVFARRLAEFERYCRAAPAAPVWEPVDLFVFHAPE
jgi:SAM-dependent methyltransferase